MKTIKISNKAYKRYTDAKDFSKATGDGDLSNSELITRMSMTWMGLPYGKRQKQKEIETIQKDIKRMWAEIDKDNEEARIKHEQDVKNICVYAERCCDYDPRACSLEHSNDCLTFKRLEIMHTTFTAG